MYADGIPRYANYGILRPIKDLTPKYAYHIFATQICDMNLCPNNYGFYSALTAPFIGRFYLIFR